MINYKIDIQTGSPMYNTFPLTGSVLKAIKFPKQLLPKIDENDNVIFDSIAEVNTFCRVSAVHMHASYAYFRIFKSFIDNSKSAKGSRNIREMKHSIYINNYRGYEQQNS